MKTFFRFMIVISIVSFMVPLVGSVWAVDIDQEPQLRVPSNWFAVKDARKSSARPTQGMKKPLLRPDLVVSNIQLTADCKIKVTIKNNGPGGVPAAAYHPTKGVIIQATAKGAGWGGYHLSMVDPTKKLKTKGKSVSYVGFKRPLSAGETLTLKVAILDPNNTANESNKSNNSLTKRLSCRRPGKPPIQRQKAAKVKTPGRLKPDLVIKMQKIEPATPTTDDEIRFSAFVHNKGPFTAGASKAGIRIGGETHPRTWNKPAISSLSSNAIVRLKRIERPGRYRVTFIADVDNDVNESNESNNQAYIDFEVTAPPGPTRVSDMIRSNVPHGAMAQIQNLFQIYDQHMMTYTFPGSNYFSFDLHTTKDVNESTLTSGAIQVHLKYFDGGVLQSQQDLTGQFVSSSSKIIRWRSNTTSYTSACSSAIDSYCEVNLYLNDSVMSQDAVQLDGDKNGQPGGQYHHTFFRGSGAP